MAEPEDNEKYIPMAVAAVAIGLIMMFAGAAMKSCEVGHEAKTGNANPITAQKTDNSSPLYDR